MFQGVPTLAQDIFKKTRETWSDSVHTRLELHRCWYLLGSTKRNC